MHISPQNPNFNIVNQPDRDTQIFWWFPIDFWSNQWFLIENQLILNSNQGSCNWFWWTNSIYWCGGCGCSMINCCVKPSSILTTPHIVEKVKPNVGLCPNAPEAWRNLSTISRFAFVSGCAHNNTKHRFKRVEGDKGPASKGTPREHLVCNSWTRTWADQHSSNPFLPLPFRWDPQTQYGGWVGAWI